MTLKNKLKVCGVVNYIIASLWVLYLCSTSFSMSLFINVVVLIITGSGLYMLGCENEYELLKKKWAFTLIGIILLFFNIIVGIIVLDAINSLYKITNGINAPPVTQATIVDPETKKFDTLLKIGVGMVLLSGIIIATSNWNGIPDLVKTGMIFGLGILFILLSLLVSKVIKVKSSEIMYFSLGMSFIWLSYFSLGWNSEFKYAFSLDHGMQLLFFASCGILAAILFFISHLKLKEEFLKVLSIFAFVVSVILLLFYLDIGIEVLFLIISLVLFILAVSFKNNNLVKGIVNVVMYVNTILMCMLCLNNNIVMLFILALVVIAYMFYTSDTKYSVCNALAICISSGFLIGSIEYRDISIPNLSIYVFVGIIFLCNLLTLIPSVGKNKMFKISLLISSIIVSLGIFGMVFIDVVDVFDDFSYLGDTNSLYICLFNSFLLALYFVIIYAFYRKKDSKSFDLCCLLFVPLLLTVMVMACEIFVSDALLMIFTIYMIIQLTLKSKDLMYVNFIFLIFGFILSSLYPDFISCILLPVDTCLYYMIIKDDDSFKNIIYIMLLIVIYACFGHMLPSLTSYSTIIFSLVVFLIFILLIVFKRTSKFSIISTMIGLFFVFVDIVDYIRPYDNLEVILYSMFIILMTLILAIFIIKKNASKLALLIIISILLYSMNIGYTDALNSGFILCLSLGLIVFGVMNDYYKSLFAIGIIFLILEIIIQLFDYLALIPFWLYLLLAGLFLIGIATYKQIKRK